MAKEEDVPVVGEKPDADFAMGGGWGDCITFAHKKQFEKPMTDDSRYTAYGFKSFMQKKPKAKWITIKKSLRRGLRKLSMICHRPRNKKKAVKRLNLSLIYWRKCR